VNIAEYFRSCDDNFKKRNALPALDFMSQNVATIYLMSTSASRRRDLSTEKKVFESMCLVFFNPKY